MELLVREGNSGVGESVGVCPDRRLLLRFGLAEVGE